MWPKRHNDFNHFFHEEPYLAQSVPPRTCFARMFHTAHGLALNTWMTPPLIPTMSLVPYLSKTCAYHYSPWFPLFPNSPSTCRQSPYPSFPVTSEPDDFMSDPLSCGRTFVMLIDFVISTPAPEPRVQQCVGGWLCSTSRISSRLVMLKDGPPHLMRFNNGATPEAALRLPWDIRWWLYPPSMPLWICDDVA